jgi:signal transduction histidine kinase
MVGPRRVTDKAVKRRLVLLAVLPALLVAVFAAALVGLVIPDVGGMSSFDQTTGLVLVVGALFACSVLIGAGLLASAEVRAIMARTAELWHFAACAQAESADARGQLTRREVLPEPTPEPRDLLPAAAPVPAIAGTVVTRPDSVPRPWRDGSLEQSEVFDHLARRLQSLVHREIGLLDQLENEVEDPDLLKGIFRVDHLATRVRRYAENIAVLGGGVSDRMWTRPVSVNDVLRSAVAEIEQYRRVKLVPPVPGMLHGHAVVDVVHLLAELAENATAFSPPQTQVFLRAEYATAGLVIEVEDRGLGMAPTERNRMNALLASRDRAIPDGLVRDGRIGLYVVATLARQHGIAVQLQSNIFGGTQAVLVLPHDLLADSPASVEPEASVTEPAKRVPVPAGTDTGYVQGPAHHPPAHAALPHRPRRVENPAWPLPGQEPAAAGSTPAVQSRPADCTDITADDPRPSLPTRNPQGHLPSELREPGRVAGRLEDVEHSPGLMAAFQSGVRQAEEAPETGSSAGPDHQ